MREKSSRGRKRGPTLPRAHREWLRSELHANGWNYNSLARKLGSTPTTVERHFAHDSARRPSERVLVQYLECANTYLQPEEFLRTAANKLSRFVQERRHEVCSENLDTLVDELASRSAIHEKDIGILEIGVTDEYVQGTSYGQASILAQQLSVAGIQSARAGQYESSYRLNRLAASTLSTIGDEPGEIKHLLQCLNDARKRRSYEHSTSTLALIEPMILKNADRFSGGDWAIFLRELGGTAQDWGNCSLAEPILSMGIRFVDCLGDDTHGWKQFDQDVSRGTINRRLVILDARRRSPIRRRDYDEIIERDFAPFNDSQGICIVYLALLGAVLAREDTGYLQTLEDILNEPLLVSHRPHAFKWTRMELDIIEAVVRMRKDAFVSMRSEELLAEPLHWFERGLWFPPDATEMAGPIFSFRPDFLLELSESDTARNDHLMMVDKAPFTRARVKRILNAAAASRFLN